MNNLKKFLIFSVILTATMNLAIAEDLTNTVIKPAVKITQDKPPQNTKNKVPDAEYRCVYQAGSCIVSVYDESSSRSARCDYSVSPRKAIIDALEGKCEKIK